MSDIPDQTIIQAKGNEYGTGNRMRLRRLPVKTRTTFHPYFAIKVKPYFASGRKAALLTFCSLDREIEIEIAGDALESLASTLGAAI